MTHAIIILAHKNISQVSRLVSYFKHDCDVFIHIDKKQIVDTCDIAKLESMPQVKAVSREYDVNWGGFSILECEIGMLRLSMEKSDAEYFHLISGQDYPVMSLDSFLEFFERNRGKEFVQYTHLPNPRWEKNTFRRFQYYYPYDLAGNRPNPRQWVWQHVARQQERGMKRAIPDEFDHLYGGSQWFSITREAVSTLLEYTKEKPSLYHRMWMTFAPEESYVATVLVNLMDQEKIENNNHRFIRWKNENGNRPANLGTEHFHLLLDGEYLFARKIETSCSLPLLDMIDKYLLPDDGVTIMPTGGWSYNGFLRYGYDAKFCGLVAQFCREVGVRTAVDIGCGAGIYVDKWVRSGLPFVGYDANPFTPTLSRLLLPQDEPSCRVADLTDDMEIKDTFDLVVCKDVLQQIPDTLEKKAVWNLSRISSHYILIHYTEQENDDTQSNQHKMEAVDCMMHDNGFDRDDYMTAHARIVSEKGRVTTIYRKQKTNLIINFYD